VSTAAADFGVEGPLVREQRFAIVPEWIIDATVSDCAFPSARGALRYGQSPGQRVPGRPLLAARLRKGSRDTVDRALKELAAADDWAVEHRHNPRRGQLTNRNLARGSPPAAVLRPQPHESGPFAPAAQPDPGLLTGIPSPPAHRLPVGSPRTGLRAQRCWWWQQIRPPAAPCASREAGP